MLINIDIRIADNEGTLLHHFEKSFEDDFMCSEKLGHHYIGESFDSFLSEYMSFSGHAVREKLIPSFSSAAANSEMEYNIQIGTKRFFAKIPINKISYPNKPDPSEEQSTAPIADQSESLDTILNYTMMKAITKYEANLYPYSKEDEYELTESEISEIPASSV